MALKDWKKMTNEELESGYGSSDEEPYNEPTVGFKKGIKVIWLWEIFHGDWKGTKAIVYPNRKEMHVKSKLQGLKLIKQYMRKN